MTKPKSDEQPEKKHVLWQRAIQSDDAEAVSSLLSKEPHLLGQCVQRFRRDGSWFLLDPLCEAANRNCIPVARVMLKAGKDPNNATGLAEYRGERDGAYCLGWADTEEMRQFLVEHGADPATIEGIEIPYRDIETVATGWGDEDNQTTDNLGQQWQDTIEQQDTERARELLERHPHLVHQRLLEKWNHWPHHPLHIAAGAGNLPLVKLLIETHCDPTLIGEVVRTTSTNVVPFLMEHTEDGQPDVGLMAYCGRGEDLKFWFERGYKVHGGMLHGACCGRGRQRGYHSDNHYPHWPQGFRDTVEVLLSAGAKVNERNGSGNEKYDGCEPWVTNQETPLHYAAAAWDIEIINQLLAAGADKSLKNDLGATPLDWAIRWEAPQEVQQLLTP